MNTFKWQSYARGLKSRQQPRLDVDVAAQRMEKFSGQHASGTLIQLPDMPAARVIMYIVQVFNTAGGFFFFFGIGQDTRGTVRADEQGGPSK